LREQRIQPGAARLDGLAALPEPTVARPPWDEVAQWS